MPKDNFRGSRNLGVVLFTSAAVKQKAKDGLERLGRALRFKNIISMLKRCHPESCPSAGEGPSLKL
jgi:hypothetical protein